MDIWEANKISAAYTPHPCSTTGLSRCSGTSCGSSDRYATVCDPDGCDFNSYRMGDTSFYGPGLKVDTSKKFTVVTQFISSDGTATGDLTEIRRLYVQNGVVIQNSIVNVPGITANTYNSITGPLCDAQKTAFGDKTQFQAKGGLKQMGVAAKNGMVLVLSVWDDHAVNMLWLDSTYPTTANATAPGVARGTCATTSGTPTDVEANSPNASVTYSNIRFGEIGSTYTGTTGSSSSTTSTTTKASTSSTSTTTVKASTTSTTSAAASTATQAKWGQW
ncbi:Exoglucanase [Blastosporella zonata]|nr:Exoglucanase [Blastosporella zonata]